MKQILLFTALLFGTVYMNAQDITNTLGPGGKFTVSSPEATGIPSSTVNLFGSVATSTKTVSGDFTFGETDQTIYIESSGSVTATLNIVATTCPGRAYYIHRSPTSSVHIIGEGIDRTLSYSNEQYAILQSTGTEWKLEIIGTSTVAGSDFTTRVRKVNITADGDSFTFEEGDQLIHLTGSKQKIICNLPDAANTPTGRIYGISLVEKSVDDMNFTFKSEGGLINGQASGDIIDWHDGHIVYYYIYSDGTDWWVFAVSNNDKEVLLLTAPITFKADADLINHNDAYYEANFTGDNHHFTITLTAAAGNIGKEYTLKTNTDGSTYSGNYVTLQTNNGEKIDGATTYVLGNDYESVTIKSNGTMWLIVNSHNH